MDGRGIRLAWKVFQPLRPLGGWLLRSPLLLLLAAVPIAAVWGAGRGLGVPELFFPDTFEAQLFAGLAAALYLAELVFVGYLLDSDQPWLLQHCEVWSPLPEANSRHGFADDLLDRHGKGEPPRLLWYAVGTFTLPLLLVLLVLPGFRAGHGGFVVGVALGIASLGIIWIIDRYVAHPLRIPGSRYIGSWVLRIRPNSHQEKHVQQAFVFGLGFGLYFALSVANGRRFSQVGSPAVVLCLFLGMAVAIYGAVRFFFQERAAGVFLILAVAGVLGLHDMAGLPGYWNMAHTDGGGPAYADHALVEPSAAGLLADDAVLERWRMRNALPDGGNPPMVVVVTSGGGIRASTWTARVLEELEKLDRFPERVRLISGASGGMVGAGAWVSALVPGDGGLRHGPFSNGLDPADAMAIDSLGDIARAALLPGGTDRGQALEDSLIAHTDGGMARTFAQLANDEREGALPSLVYAPMVVEDGRRMVVSNLDLRQVLRAEAALLGIRGVDGGPTEAATEPWLLSLSGAQLFQLFPGAQRVVTVAEAARMNASFPWVSPAARLPTRPMVRLVDTGYYDNYGVDIAASWIFENRAWIRRNTSGLVVIEIRDSLEHSSRQRLQLKPTEGGARLGAWISEELSGLLSPPEAVLAARESSMSYRNDELLELLDRSFNADPDHPCFFITAAFEFERQAPLSWALTEPERRAFLDDVDAGAFRATFDDLRTWWSSRSSSACRRIQMADGGRVGYERPIP